MSKKLLRALVDLRNQQVQKARIQFGLRLGALDRGDDQASYSGQREVIEKWHEHLQELEKEIDRDIAAIVADLPIYEHVTAVKGIGPSLTAQMVALIDIERANQVSSLWKYAGYGLGKYWMDQDGNIVAPRAGHQWKKNGKGEKEKVWVIADPQPGWKLVEVRDRAIKTWCLCYNKRLKVIMWKVGKQLMRKTSPYRPEYERARELYEKTHPEWGDMRKDRAARRKVIKLFLSHLWERWRKLEGLPTREVYVQEVLGHTHISRPEDYGWPELDQSQEQEANDENHRG